MSAAPTIPFNRPFQVGTELEYVRQAFASGRLSGDGPFTQRCSELLERITGTGKALLTTSCTHALEMAALLLDIGPGDEVIVPSFTFVSTANAFALRGARPVFADSRVDTLNLDERLLESLITERTRAIVVVHYGGVACDMEAILAVADARGIAVVEDNAHGLFGSLDGSPLGSFGRLATLSFHETKNISCGEGGALLINDPSLVERAEIIREKGTDRSKFFRGQIDKYTWTDLGSSYLPSEILAAVLLSQLEAGSEIQARRQTVWQGYATELSSWAQANGIALPHVPATAGCAFHLFHMLMPSLAARTALIEGLRAVGIQAVFHYVPLHLSRMGQQFGAGAGDCPVAEDVAERLVRLPFHTGLEQADQRRIIDALLGMAF